jgi:hypothetical protein
MWNMSTGRARQRICVLLGGSRLPAPRVAPKRAALLSTAPHRAAEPS